MNKTLLAILTLGLALGAQAQEKKPTQVCAWVVETRDSDFENFEFWAQADHDFEFFYVIGGQGIVRGSGHASSPSKGSMILHPGRPEKIKLWGTSPGGPAKVDLVLEVREKPADIFSEKEKPLLAKFLFARNIPESETKPPATLAKKQCVAIKAGK